MKIALIFAAPLVLLLACSSSTKTEQDKGLTSEGEGAAASAPDTNPDGVAYPTDHIGRDPRAGNRAGNRIANFKFLGYLDADVSKGLQPISLASYFDPLGKRYSIIHLDASGSWCPACQKELEAASAIKDELDKRKVVWIVSLAEGPTPGTPATRLDLDQWLSKYEPPYTHLLDPGNKNLGIFYDARALPWSANISARTMEILSSGVGGAGSGPGILEDLDDAIGKLDSDVGLK